MLIEPADIEKEELPSDYFDDPPPLPSEQRKPHGIDMIDFYEVSIEIIYNAISLRFMILYFSSTTQYLTYLLDFIVHIQRIHINCMTILDVLMG